jgi:hypothetical protein
MSNGDKLESFAGIDFDQLSQLLTAGKACEYLQTLGIEISQDRLRGLARAGKVPGAGKVVGKIAFVKEALADWTPPESVGVSRRDDGRRPYKLYLLPEEKAQIEELGIGEFAKPKKRKAKKDEVEAGVEGSDPDPFETFEAEA